MTDFIFETKFKENEKGAALLSILLFIILMGMMSASLAILVVSETRVTGLNADERRAFYAAHSGLEYGIRRIMEYPGTAGNSLSNLNNSSENLDTGSGTSCTVSFNVISTDSVIINAIGRSQRYKKRLQHQLKLIDVSQYAIYTTGTVDNYTYCARYLFSSHDPSLLYQNATIMPLFDLESLRNQARPSNYYNGNLSLSGYVTLSPWNSIFTEGDLTLTSWNWLNISASFIVRGDIYFNSAWLPFATNFGVVYQPEAGRNFTCSSSFLGRSVIGGIISNGNIIGSDNYHWLLRPGKLNVFYYPITIRSFMINSVNGGPLLIKKSLWRN
jgi:hypothetical protein